MSSAPSSPEEKAQPDLSLLVIHSKKDEDESFAAPPWRAWLGWGVALVILGGGAAALWFARDSLFPPTVKTLIVRVPTRSEMNALLTASGHVAAQRESNVASKVVGTVVQIGVREGSRVEAGQVIARLDDRGYQAQRAELAVEIGQDEREWKRLQKLLKDGFVSEVDVERAQNKFDLDRARLKTIETQIENTIIRSPFTGVVTRKNIEVGEIVTSVGAGIASGGVAKIVDMDSLEVEADVTESNLHRVKEGQPAEIVIDSMPGVKLRGRLRQIVPTADRQKATVKIKVSVLAETKEERAARARLLPDMAAQATFLKNENSNTPASGEPTPPITIPASAVVEENGGKASVFVLRDGLAWRRSVEILSSENGRIEARSGLTEGDVIVIEGASRLRDGQKVKTAEPS